MVQGAEHLVEEAVVFFVLTCPAVYHTGGVASMSYPIGIPLSAPPHPRKCPSQRSLLPAIRLQHPNPIPHLHTFALDPVLPPAPKGAIPRREPLLIRHLDLRNRPRSRRCPDPPQRLQRRLGRRLARHPAIALPDSAQLHGRSTVCVPRRHLVAHILPRQLLLFLRHLDLGRPLAQHAGRELRLPAVTSGKVGGCGRVGGWDCGKGLSCFLGATGSAQFLPGFLGNAVLASHFGERLRY